MARKRQDAPSEELDRLRTELAKLEAENAILKAALRALGESALAALRGVEPTDEDDR